jgi:hypothetical protein
MPRRKKITGRKVDWPKIHLHDIKDRQQWLVYRNTKKQNTGTSKVLHRHTHKHTHTQHMSY